VPRDFPFIDRSFVADLNGVLMADSPALPDVRGQSFATRDWYQGVRRGWRPYISDVYQRNAVPRFNVIAAAVPVKAENGAPVAILILQVKLESLLAWIKDIDVGAQGEVLVVDRIGNLVAHPALNLQGEIRNLSRSPAIQKALRGGAGVETVAETNGAVESLYAYAPLPGYGWAVVVQQPLSLAYASRDRSLIMGGLTYGVILLFNCILAYFMLASLIRAKRGEESLSRLAAIVESSDDAIFSNTLDGKIITWNKGAESTYGYSAPEVEGRPMTLLVSPKRSGEIESILERIRRGEVVTGYETEQIKKDGGIIDVALTVSPIRNADGKVVAASAVSRDVTQRRQLREELREKNKILQEQYQVVQEANRLKSEFLANMSHELRTPLNAIIGFAQLMHDGRVGPVSEKHKEYLGDILGSGRHLLELINDVLDLAKVESGKMEFAPEPAEVAPLIDQVRAILQNQFTAKRLNVESHIASGLEQLTIDPARFKQVLYNYFSNAIKFTPAGGQISIRVLNEDKKQFRLEVEDSGIGISPERLDELFIEFKQLEPGLSKTHQGTGLGLALTKRIVEAQGGRVGARSTLGRGSLFFAILPKRGAPSEKGRGEEPSAIVNPDYGPQLLVVEDDKEDLRWLHQTLAQAGYVIDSATSGAEAIAKTQRAHYDAILLDLILPDALGWDVLNVIRKEELNRDAPVIVVTVVSEKSAAKSFALQDYLPKPVTAAALLSALRRAGIIADGAGKKILVVDDDPNALKLASAALESSGYQASCHSNAESALESAAKSILDAVILDLLMPGMDGFEFLERLRKIANCRETPVIIWTAKELTTAERERLKRSASSIAVKGGGGIDAVLRELRYHITHGVAAAPQ
ncbi:MAG: response regulator, partial [Chloroflexota bacterium]